MSNPKLVFMQDLLLFKMRGEYGGGAAILSAADGVATPLVS